MKMQKSPQDLIDLFASVMPGHPATSRKMFGYPAGFVNGNMFMGLFADEMILRLPEDMRKKLVTAHGAKIFEPMPGRPMKEYVALPRAARNDRKELAAWVASALEFGESLEPKSKAKKPVKSRAKKRSA